MTTNVVAAPDSAAPPDIRARLDRLIDPDSFVEFGSQARHQATAFGMAGRRPAGDGVVTGIARIDGRDVAVFVQDPSVLGGSLGETHAAKITHVARWAARSRMPTVGLLDSGGARIQEGVGALDGYGRIFRTNVAQSGRTPQISVVLGACAGGAVYSPALTDVVIMCRDRGRMFLTGPKVVKAVTREDVTAEELGGARLHERRSGVAHLVAEDLPEALALTRRVLGYLPSSCWDEPPIAAPVPPEPMPVIPQEPRHAYDVRGVIRGIADGGSFFELHRHFAPNLVVGFGRMDGEPVGFVANQPQSMAGVLNITASEKGARFVRLCDAFGLPLVVLVDTPGFLPGTRQEADGVIRKGAKLLYAFAEATVPRVTVVLRKAYGGAYIVMNSKSLGADAVLAWPFAELAVMGAEGAVDVIHHRDIGADPLSRPGLIERYQSEAMAPHIAAARLSVDEIIEPARTGAVLRRILSGLRGARRLEFRHDNLPQ